jgi:hypothetical protein
VEHHGYLEAEFRSLDPEPGVPADQVAQHDRLSEAELDAVDDPVDVIEEITAELLRWPPREREVPPRRLVELVVVDLRYPGVRKDRVHKGSRRRRMAAEEELRLDQLDLSDQGCELPVDEVDPGEEDFLRQGREGAKAQLAKLVAGLEGPGRTAEVHLDAEVSPGGLLQNRMGKAVALVVGKKISESSPSAPMLSRNG